MVRLVGFPRPSLKNCSRFLIVTLLLSFPQKAMAEPIWAFNPDRPSPKNINLLKDNWSNSRSNPSCFGERGRAFDISINNLSQGYEAINLKALSVLVFVPPASISSFDWSVFRLTLLPGAKENLLGSGLPSTAQVNGVGAVADPNVYSYYKTNISDVFYTFEVLFTFPPFLMKKGQLYTAVLECRTTGSQNIYSVWETQKLGNVGATAAFDGSKIIPYGYNASVQHSLYGEKTLLYHPVVLIHDFGGLPKDFEDNGYPALLSGESFNPKYVKFFDFGNNESGYKSAADIKTLTPKFTDDLNNLSADYVKEGGDGEVDVVAFGLGNFVVKDHLLKNKNQNKVRNFVSVASPNRGSWLVDIDRNPKATFTSSPRFNSKVAGVFHPLLKNLNVWSSGRDPASLASFLNQAQSGSDITIELSDSNKLPPKSAVKYFNIVGEISVVAKQTLFTQEVEGKSSLGDGSVLIESAVFSCELTDTDCRTTFTEQTSLTKVISKTPTGFSSSFSSPDLSSLKYLHNKLIGAAEVKNKIKEILSTF